MSGRPPSGSSVWWRFKKDIPTQWNYGYVTYVQGQDLIRMGRSNGDRFFGPVVSAGEIEWKEYR